MMSCFEIMTTFFFAFLIILGFYTVNRHYSALRDINEYNLLKLQIETKFDLTIVEQLEDFISNIFDDYIITSKLLTQVYITEQDEVELRKDISNLVAERISPYMYQKLSICYNETQLPDIIAGKIYQLVTAYVIERNSVKPTLDKI